MNLEDKVLRLPGFDPIKRFAKLERVLAAVLVLTPVLLILFDIEDGVRGSISAYYDMSQPVYFYFPLTVGAMLFIVNGVVKDGHWYNWALGVLLAILVVFDHEGASKPFHYVGAVGFFVGNFSAMIWFSKRKSPLIIAGLIVALIAAGLTWVFASLFWAEWISLGVVAAHYILDSADPRVTAYTALKEHDEAKLIPATATAS